MSWLHETEETQARLKAEAEAAEKMTTENLFLKQQEYNRRWTEYFDHIEKNMVPSLYSKWAELEITQIFKDVKNAIWGAVGTARLPFLVVLDKYIIHSKNGKWNNYTYDKDDFYPVTPGEDYNTIRSIFSDRNYDLEPYNQTYLHGEIFIPSSSTTRDYPEFNSSMTTSYYRRNCFSLDLGLDGMGFRVRDRGVKVVSLHSQNARSEIQKAIDKELAAFVKEK